jgi:hypothetical protein
MEMALFEILFSQDRGLEITRQEHFLARLAAALPAKKDGAGSHIATSTCREQPVRRRVTMITDYIYSHIFQ